MKFSELKKFLDSKVARYEQYSFCESDPIGIVHTFHKKEDIEIAAFLAASIAWGQRKTIIRNATFLLDRMDRSPHDFILNFTDDDLRDFENFKHRTFNFDDLKGFFVGLQNLYTNHGGLEPALSTVPTDMAKNISKFKQLFFEAIHLPRTRKHVADPLKGSAAKRINMYLRWMVRPAAGGVDFGLWKSIKPGQLYLPLDVHTGSVGRKLGLLKRNQNDWKAVEEITKGLRKFDSEDPVKYDYALFGLGVFEGF